VRPDAFRDPRTGDERGRNPDGLLGAECLTLHRHRLGEGTAIGVVGVAERLDMRQPGTGIVLAEVEERRVGQGKPEGPAQEEGGEHGGTESDSEGGHGCNLSGRPAGDNPTPAGAGLSVCQKSVLRRTIMLRPGLSA
jgi:hypothetical protein